MWNKHQLPLMHSSCRRRPVSSAMSNRDPGLRRDDDAGINRRLHPFRWLAAVLLCVVFTATGVAGGTQPLQERLAERRCERYTPATPGQLQLAEAAFAALLQAPAAVDGEAVKAWQTLGYQLQRVSDGEANWLLLQQLPGQCTGQGLYLLRLDAVADVAVQIPHGYFDRYTDAIGAGLLQAPVRVIAFNTARRSFTRHGRKIDADLAHRSDNYFAALTRAFGRVFPHGRLLQLHGFNAAKRTSAAGRSAAAIISNGSGTPSVGSAAVAACLQTLAVGPVRVYPREVRELGATKNVQGQLLRAYGHAGFVHVELNRALRERLRADDTLRDGFAACLCSGMQIP